jgi:hypothetical protein
VAVWWGLCTFLVRVVVDEAVTVEPGRAAAAGDGVTGDKESGALGETSRRMLMKNALLVGTGLVTIGVTSTSLTAAAVMLIKWLTTCKYISAASSAAASQGCLGGRRRSPLLANCARKQGSRCTSSEPP